MGKNNNYWVNSGLFAVSQRISIPLFGIGTFLIIVRALPKEEMGIWVLFVTIASIIEITRNGLIKAALVKYYTEASKSERHLIASAALLINTIYTVLVQCILVAIGGQLVFFFEAPGLDKMLWVYSINALLFVPFSHFEYVQQANLQFKGIFFSYFVRQGWFFVCILTLILILGWSVSLQDLVYLQASGLFFGAIVSYRFARKNLIGSVRFSKYWFSKLMSFGKFGLYTNLSNSALTTSDHVLIGGLLSTASVAIHNVSSRITNVFVIPSIAIADILYPKAVKANQNKGTAEVKMLYQNAVAATIVPMIPVVIFVELFPEIIIELLAGSEYLSAVNILRVAIIGILFLPFLKQFGTVMNTINRPDLNFYFVFCLAGLNVVLNYFCIVHFGIIGGAIGTLSSYVIGCFASQVILHRLVSVSSLSILSQTVIYYRQIFQWIKKKTFRK